MGCATGFLKYSLALMNIVWTIIGVLFVVFGALGWDAMPRNYAIGVIGLGSAIVLMSFFGCFAAIRNSARAMWLYSVMLLMLLVVIVIFICFSSQNVFKNYAKHMVEEIWEKELTHPGSMDTIQTTYECCGLDMAEDYLRNDRIIPSSCCKHNNCINPLNLYIVGCRDKVEADFADEAAFTHFSQWGLFSVDLIILILSTLLAIRFTNYNRRHK